MPIERDPKPEFHTLGTLISVTQWISSHEDGFAEWLKNTRRAYQPDRANVSPQNSVAIILLQDRKESSPARMGLLDVGGATSLDLEKWNTWQDPEASSRDSDINEEITQGNGGKAYMYKMFSGQARLLGVKEGKKNCRGFEGENSTIERGTPGFIPNKEEGDNSAIDNWKTELNEALAPYGLNFDTLPRKVRIALDSREAFTLVEGVDPKDIFQGRIDTQSLIKKILRHNQTTLAIEQISRIYASHNGVLVNNGRPIEFEEIEPYPGYDQPIEIPIPEELPDDNDNLHSTTLNETKPLGKLIICTSKENMPNAYRKLRPRWKITYRTEHQIIGSKPVSELIPTTPGKDFLYATVELPALDDYVSLGRTRPTDEPFVRAIDRFVTERLKELAKQISAQQKTELDKETLDDVHKENKLLNRWKDKWLEAGGIGAGGSGGEEGEDTKITRPPPPPIEWGTEPEFIEIDRENEVLKAGRGASIFLPALINPIPRDHYGKPVPNIKFEWVSSDSNIADFFDPSDGILKAKNKGKCEIRVKIPNTDVISEPVIFQIYIIEHIMVVPRNIKVPLGKRKLITAEVKTDDKHLLTDVLLNWKHDADDQMTVKIRPTGWVTGGRLGKTTVTAGVDDPKKGNGVWSAIGTDVEVIKSDAKKRPGEGYPQLLLTDRDLDPFDGQIRPSDPEEPPLWQSVTDAPKNIWWINLGAKDADFAFSMIESDSKVWRLFHSKMVAEMVIQAHMANEYTRKGEDEQKARWSDYKDSIERLQVDLWPRMWEELKVYVNTGEGLD